ncbi:uncharacterized protein HMPREF1541_08280 [Cyphellophora europaea CBS 101466]|uniref:UDP-galactose transporter n=1 Tax=Cyphellophora europaea (strain CBS 101466) TaxID=1220924 RepID=W2RNH9_CYPE1|nr:uncharacterized protein HMPREF1541_08280 [Cyphellophora europaea CBS 101466]ETN37289.1 hypothetical protein HMPREF1541_08280 [Cyphellophora europaea CBS 101466]
MTDAVATIGGVPTRYLSLVVLVIQNSALVLTMRYSRILPGPQYLSSTAVVMSELIKCVICLLVHLHEQRTNSHSPSLPLLSDSSSSTTAPRYTLSQLFTDIFSVRSGFLKLLIPAILYTLQNNLQFVAATNLDAATFQVTYQCKILTTALFAVLLLRQSLTPLKWLSLFVLTMGVACVQIPSAGTPTSFHQGSYPLGILAVAIACLCSGFAGVYFEKVLKSSSSSTPSTSLWVRNIQLSVGCLAIALTGTFIWDGRAIAQGGFFQGYRPITVVTICIQAAGGLIVALVIKYADNILKGFATSLSIILSTVVSVFVFQFVVTIYFLIGTVLVFSATYMYSIPDKKPTATEQDLAIRDRDEAKGDEGTPMISINDYDEDRRDMEKAEGEFRDDVPSRGASQEFSEKSDDKKPNGESTADKPKAIRVYDELGYVD